MAVRLQSAFQALMNAPRSNKSPQSPKSPKSPNVVAGKSAVAMPMAPPRAMRSASDKGIFQMTVLVVGDNTRTDHDLLMNALASSFGVVAGPKSTRSVVSYAMCMYDPRDASQQCQKPVLLLPLLPRRSERSVSTEQQAEEEEEEKGYHQEPSSEEDTKSQEPKQSKQRQHSDEKSASNNSSNSTLRLNVSDALRPTVLDVHDISPLIATSSGGKGYFKKVQSYVDRSHVILYIYTRCTPNAFSALSELVHNHIRVNETFPPVIALVACDMLGGSPPSAALDMDFVNTEQQWTEHPLITMAPLHVNWDTVPVEDLKCTILASCVEWQAARERAFTAKTRFSGVVVDRLPVSVSLPQLPRHLSTVFAAATTAEEGHQRHSPVSDPGPIRTCPPTLYPYSSPTHMSHLEPWITA